MKYEFILKERTRVGSPFYIRYKCIVEEKEFQRVKEKYEKFVKNELQVLLINQLNDAGEFETCIQ